MRKHKTPWIDKRSANTDAAIRHNLSRLNPTKGRYSLGLDQFSLPGLTWCWVQARQDHLTVINVIDAVVAGTETFSESPEWGERRRRGDTGL